MSTAHAQPIQLIGITPNYFTIYNERQPSARRDNPLIKNEIPTDNQHKGTLSFKAQKRIQKALDWLVYVTKEKVVVNPTTNTTFSFKLSMLTLTLPCKQLHSDKFIKNKMLNSFLTTLRTKFYLENYVWKAEKTEAGVIHFHLIIDRFIDHKEINRLWNKVLRVNGYIAEYQKNMLEHHKGGFKPFIHLLKHWNYQQQLKAYKNGIRQNFTEPTGTTDIHSLRKINNAGAYVKKYMQKNPDQTRLFKKLVQDYCNKHNCVDVPAATLAKMKEYIKKKLSVEGNIWYISRSLSHLKSAVDIIHNKLAYEITHACAKFKEKVITKDFATIVCVGIEELNQAGYKSICKVFIDHILKIRSLFYPKKIPIYV